MYYYGVRYYDPRISIFISVDPLAEQTMEPYLYTGNNPIMFTDPTGMVKEGADGPPDPPKKSNQKGDKVLNFKYKGRDESIYENDDNLLAKGYRMFKSIREKSDEFLSGGFYFYDDEGKPKGDQSLMKDSKGKRGESINVTGLMQMGSIAKSGEGMKWDIEDVKTPLVFFNNVYSGKALGESLPESKMTINIGYNQYGNVADQNGKMTTERIGTEKRDSTIMAKDFIKVRLKINKENANRFYRKKSEMSHFKSN